jgi:DegV family protein with EDD domain
VPDGAPSDGSPRGLAVRWRARVQGVSAWAGRVARRDADRPAPDAVDAPPPPTRVAVVTDSTSCLTAADAAAWGVDVVPLDVAADGERYRDGVDLTPEGLAGLLASGKRVTTSQPPPAAFAAAYEAAAGRGAAEVVSVHLSGELSGTVRAAGLAAQLAPLPVHVVDSRSAGMGLGLAVLAAAELARGDVWGGPADGTEVADAAEQVGRSTAAWFVVDSLDHLRRGGRLSGAAAAFGTVLGLRPVLTLRDGRIEVAERVRTRRAARDRLHQLAVDEVRRRGPAVRVAVQHLGRADVAAELAERVRATLGLDEVLVREVGAVLGGHLGVGALAMIVTDR